MNEAYEASKCPIEPGFYEIRVTGHLDNRWAGWFKGLTINLEPGGSTRLTGQVADQAALHGLLSKVRDLGLVLISVNRVQPGQAGNTGHKQKR